MTEREELIKGLRSAAIYLSEPRKDLMLKAANMLEADGKQEPVAWRYKDSRGNYRYRGYVPNFDVEYKLLKPVPLYAAPVAQNPLNEWMPIETAPKTGRELILLLTTSKWPQIAYSDTWWISGHPDENQPTHWMPIPQIENANGIGGVE